MVSSPSPDSFQALYVGWNGLLSIGLALFLTWRLAIAVYHLYFHPLAQFPGPKLWAISQLPFLRSLVNGTMAHKIKGLHDMHGEVVRITPNHLSFTHPDAWQDIYNYKLDRPHFTKNLKLYPESMNKVPSILNADDPAWAVHRRLFSYGFSEKALRDHQIPLLQIYITRLTDALHKQIAGPNNGKVDIMRWLNYITFDLTADLIWGESLHCLEDGNYHPWVSMVFDNLKLSICMVAIRGFPILNAIVTRLIPSSMKQLASDHFNLCVQWTNRRLAADSDRPDFVILLHSTTGGKGLTMDELYSDVPLLLIGGSETSAAALSSCIYHLCVYPQTMETLRAEFQRDIKTSKDVTLSQLSKLEYLTAVITEAMRVYPPVAGYHPRVAPVGGAYVGGHFIPEGTEISIIGYAIAHSSRNFKQPKAFVPERWLEGNPDFASDRKDAFEPFSVGPRNCIGKNLAWAKMRLILYHLLQNFDFELCEQSKDWVANQKSYVVWEKPPLMVKLVPRQRAADR